MASPALPLSTLPFRTWCPLPSFYCEKIHPVLSNLQNSVFLIIYSRTMGRKCLPDSAVLNIVALARQLKASEMGVHNAIRELLTKGLIEECPEKRGRSRQYKIAVRNLQSASERIYGAAQPRRLTVIKTLRRRSRAETWPRSQEQTPQAGVEQRQGERTMGDNQSDIAEVEATSASCNSGDAGSSKNREDQKIPPVKSEVPANRANLVNIPPKPGCCPYCSSPIPGSWIREAQLDEFNEARPTPVSAEQRVTYPDSRMNSRKEQHTEFPRVEDQALLEKMCHETIMPKLQAPMPPGLVLKTLQALGDAPLDNLTKRIRRRIDAFDRYEWGLLPQLAADVRKTYETAPRKVPPQTSRHYEPDAPYLPPLNKFIDMVSEFRNAMPTRSEWLDLAGAAYDFI